MSNEPTAVGTRRAYVDTHAGEPPGQDAVWTIEEWDGEGWSKVDRVVGVQARDAACGWGEPEP